MHPLFHVSTDRLAHEVARATLLSIGGRSAAFLLQMLGLAVIARLTTPADFGVFAMVAPFIAIVLVFGDLGLASAILQQPRIEQGQASALFWVSILAGAALTALFLAGAPMLARLYRNEAVEPVAAALSLLFLLSSLTSVQQALLRRALLNGALLRAQLAGAFAALAVGTALAAKGAGYWALVGRALSDPAIYAVAVWYSTGWLPTRPDWDGPTKSMIRYGQFFLGFKVLNTLSKQCDNVLIGWRFGAGELGLYAIAYKLFLFPVQQISHPFGHVMIPAMSRLRDDPARMRRWYLKSLRLLTFLAFPPIISLVFCAEEVIAILVGSQWLPAAPILALLAPAGALHVGYTSIGWLMQSQGRSDRNFYWAAITTPIYLAAFIVGLPWGAVGVAAAYSTAYCLLFLPGFLFATKGTAITLADVLKAMGPAAAMLAGLLPTMFVVTRHFFPAAGSVAKLAAIGVLVLSTMMIGALLTFGPRTMRRSVRGLFVSREAKAKQAI